MPFASCTVDVPAVFWSYVGENAAKQYYSCLHNCLVEIRFDYHFVECFPGLQPYGLQDDCSLLADLLAHDLKSFDCLSFLICPKSLAATVYDPRS